MNREEILSSDKLKYFIMSLSKKFYNVDKHDLYQAGYIGALKALKRYDINSDAEFTTYAYKDIFGEMYELARNNRNIKLNKNYLKIYKSIENAKILLTQKLNKTPSLDEVSRYLEIDIGLINDVIITCKDILSLDIESDVLNENNMYSILGENIDYDTKILVNDSLETLNNDERQVIDMRYFKDYSQQETADALGINQVKVSRLESSSKKKIKKYICA